VFEPFTVKCTGAGATFFRQKNENYWRYTYEFRMRARATATNPLDGWLETVLDRGLTRWAGKGADDGFGGSFSLAGTDHEDGMAHAATIRGPLGDRVPELVLLDGHGSPLASDAAAAAEGIYFRWRVNPIEDLRAIPLKIFTGV
jgi:hypothetical protein